MNKLAIPALLVATVMVAGAFAFMPVEQASTVHTSAVSSNILVLSLDEADLDTGDVYTVACDQDFVLTSLHIVVTAGTVTDETLTTVSGDQNLGSAVATGADGVVIDLLDDVPAGNDAVFIESDDDIAITVTAAGGDDDGDENWTLYAAGFVNPGTICTFTETT